MTQPTAEQLLAHLESGHVVSLHSTHLVKAPGQFDLITISGTYRGQLRAVLAKDLEASRSDTSGERA